MKPIISDAQAPLLRAVERLLVAALAYGSGRSITVITEAAVSEDWASATFVGQRHRLELRLEVNPGGVMFGDDRDTCAQVERLAPRAALMASVTALAEAIGETDIDVPGHFVADIAVISVDQLDSGAVQLMLEALTLLN